MVWSQKVSSVTVPEKGTLHEKYNKVVVSPRGTHRRRPSYFFLDRSTAGRVSSGSFFRRPILITTTKTKTTYNSHMLHGLWFDPRPPFY